MRRHLVTAAILFAAASAAQAQDPIAPLSLSDFDGSDPQQASKRFSPDRLLGARVGFVMAIDAEEAVPFIGAGLRLPIAEVAAIELSLDVWRDEYAGGDAQVTHVPLMISAMFYYPLETPSTAPYILAGVGLHNLAFAYSGALGGETDDTDSEFAFHAGAGLEMTIGALLKVHMDVRWIMIDPDPAAAGIEDEDFDTVQFTFALSLRF